MGKPSQDDRRDGGRGCLRQSLGILEDGPEVWNQLSELSRHHIFAGRQVHDANIVATMMAHGEHRLLTFNIGDFQRFAAVIELVPP